MKNKIFYFTLLLTLFSLITEVKAQNCSINAGGNVTICGTSHTLAGSSSGSQSGLPTWIIVSKPSGAPDPIISDINSYTPLVSGLNFPGNYTFEIQQNCTSGSVSSQVTITAPGAVSTFTAGADITNVPATVGEVTLNGVVPAGYTAQWTAINIYNNERFGQVNSANAEFTSTTSPTTTFRLIKKANHDVDPAYRVRLKITSTLNPNCSYEDELIVRFIPNPEVSFVNVSNCLGTDDPSESYYVQFASNSPIFATRENNVSGNPAFGTTVSINVVSQPAGANMTYKDISVNRLFLNGTDVIGTYVFTVTVTNASGSFTTPNVSYTNNGMNVSPVSFITPDRPEQIAAYSIGLSGGEVHCASMAGTHTPITFLFTIDPSDPASVITTISNRGVAPPGGFPTFILNGAGTHNRSVTLTPPATGWSVGTYRIGIVTRSVSGACSRSQDYFIHISDGNREDVSVDDITVCYPGSGSVTAIVPLPEIYQQVVNSSYLQDFRGMYQFATLSRPAGSAVPVFQSADQRTLTHTSTTISNLNREGEYVFSIQALPSTGGVGPFLEKEYECSDASLIGTFKIYVSSQVNANAGSDKTINCISETTLNGNNPGVTSTGIWTIVSKPAGAPDPVFSNPTLYNTTVSSLTFAGNYVFRWTITTGECTSFDDVTVNVTMDNCPNPNCLPNLFLSQNGQLFDILTDTNPFTFPPIGSNFGSTYNALGFNPVDGFLYAINGESTVAQLLKINPTTGETQILGNLVTTGGSTFGGSFTNGDFDENGNYYIKGQSASGMYKVNVTTLVASAVFFSPAGNYNSADFAYNIQDGLLYATRNISGQGTQLFSINPANGQINDIGTPHLPGITFGAMFGDSEGRIFGSSNGGGFYQFNLTTGEKILISDSPASTNNDGAHCVQTPISFGADPFVTKTNPDPGYTAGQTTVFTVTVGNNGPFGIMGVGVTDLVPSGIPTANVTYSATAAGGAVTTVSGTQVGDINDVVNLPVGGTVTYTVTVNVPSSFNGNLTNSVELTISDNSSYDIDLTNNTASVTLGSNVCFKDPVTSGVGLDTEIGISLLRGENTNDWPQSRKSGFIALESNSQGVVVSRIEKANLTNILFPQEGMLVYDITDNCLKIYSDNEWKCFNIPACP